MLRNILIISLLALSPAAFSAEDESQAARDDIVVKSENNSVFKGLLYKVWGKLRAYSPKKVKYRNRAAVTAGIRGNETTTSLIQPYWKDDLTDDPAFQKELQQYSRAQGLAEDGDLDAASKALSEFIEEYDDSDLKPTAQFALGVTYGGMGNSQAGIEALNDFVSDHPDHPLVPDARQVISELR